ncbi:BglG family transcription antiterminator [Sporanaerobacter sp. PP17-6a]|uniref:BglG family transcription antiterminator n=1 Tax=Sporanaerobacter sp. PP17-6a TaxID=1891289 RepID=UPI00089FAAF4|nr:PRD domain-containing protein [Sporanaerobacter sp. PP17-6a]SCL88383.1 putative licABCH operon regulator [Sporanaerobacter sp. PP17-6a]
MEENKKRLLAHLLKTNDWVTSDELSILLSVSTRTVRNYIKQLNTTYKGYELIFSSSRGYKINKKNYYLILNNNDKYNTVETPQQRINFIRNKLITHPKGYNLFVLSSDLFVSEETILADINSLQAFFKNFSIVIKKNNSMDFYLSGLERDKRKMIRYIVNNESSENFTPTKALAMFSMELNSTEYNNIRNSIHKILNKNNLFVNDYALNNITLHLIVMVQRIRQGLNIAEDVQMEKIQNTKEAKVADEIKKYLNNSYGITMNESEFYYLTLTISSYTSEINYSLVNSHNIQDFIEGKYIDIAKQAIEKVKEVFSFDIFDDEFLPKFTIHIRNLMIRTYNGMYTKNPLTAKIKEAYPLIYEIAVFIALELQRYEDVYISEDEIAFIAIHIGAEIEKNNSFNKKVTAVFVYLDYYDTHLKAYNKIRKIFENSLEIINMVSINNFCLKEIKTDMIISCVPIISDDDNVIVVSPFISDEDVSNINSKLTMIKRAKKQKKIEGYLKSLFGSTLFKRNYYLKDEHLMIKNLTNEVIALKYANPEFYEEVEQREKMSPTSFNNLVAVPHSLKHNAYKSFISMVINEKPMKWGNQYVNIIVLIGISETDRSTFRDVFDILIEILSEPKNVQKLINCSDYDEFLATITNMIEI